MSVLRAICALGLIIAAPCLNSSMIIHTVPAISNEASGPSYSVVRLCEALIADGVKIELAALDWTPLELPPHFLHTFPLGWGPRRLGRSPTMYRWLMHQARSQPVDIIHSHGMWQMNAVYPGWVARKTNVPLVVSPRGALSEWALAHGLKAKRLFWSLLQQPSLELASCFHATALSEYEDIRRLGFRQPVAVIPNGIDVPPMKRLPEAEYRTLLFLGRVHPKKGLDLLLPAWQALQHRYPNWQLRIVGPDDGGHLAQMRALARKLDLARIEFSGAVYGERKWQAYRDAELFVLPTYSENFGMAVAESLAAGTPAIVSKGAPWQGLQANGAGWWVDIGVEQLIDCLSDALSRPPAELIAMGRNGRTWMERDYSWKSIGVQMNETYRWLCNRELPTPPWIMFNE